MQYIKISGSAFDIKLWFATYGIDVESVDAVMDFLLNNPTVLSEGEIFEKRFEVPDIPPGALMHALIYKEKYYVNLKLTTLWVVAHLINSKLRLDELNVPIIEVLLGFSGIPLPTITKLSELFGETCIVRETMLRKGKVGSTDILVPFKGKCCNYDLKCRFREGDNCFCTPKDILEIYESLAEQNMFEQNGDKFEYQW